MHQGDPLLSLSLKLNDEMEDEGVLRYGQRLILLDAESIVPDCRLMIYSPMIGFYGVEVENWADPWVLPTKSRSQLITHGRENFQL